MAPIEDIVAADICAKISEAVAAHLNSPGSRSFVNVIYEVGQPLIADAIRAVRNSSLPDVTTSGEMVSDDEGWSNEESDR